MHLLDTGSGTLLHRLPLGWRGPAGQLPDAEEWQAFEVVTSVQLLPGSPGLLLAGCMDGCIQLLDSRRSQPAVVQLNWGDHQRQARAQLQRRFWRAGDPARLCAARCHEHLLVAGGDAAAVSLHDLRMVGGYGGSSSGNGSDTSSGRSGGGFSSGSQACSPSNGCFAELALPAAFGLRVPSVFAMDLLYPRLAAGGDRGQVQVRVAGRRCMLTFGAAQHAARLPTCSHLGCPALRKQLVGHAASCTHHTGCSDQPVCLLPSGLGPHPAGCPSRCTAARP